MTWLRLHWDRVAGWSCIALGLVFLLVGYLGISSTGYVAEQLPYIASGGIGGMFFLGFGGMLLLSADLRDEWRKLDRIEEVLSAAHPAVAEPVEAIRVAENGRAGSASATKAVRAARVLK